jgi:hypothetical protein
MSSMTRLVLSAAILLSTGFSALAATKAQVGATREQAAGGASAAGSAIAGYDRNGGVVGLPNRG